MLTPGCLSLWGPDCRSWSIASRATSMRNVINAYGVGYDFVVAGNLMVSRLGQHIGMICSPWNIAAKMSSKICALNFSWLGWSYAFCAFWLFTLTMWLNNQGLTLQVLSHSAWFHHVFKDSNRFPGSPFSLNTTGGGGLRARYVMFLFCNVYDWKSLESLWYKHLHLCYDCGWGLSCELVDDGIWESDSQTSACKIWLEIYSNVGCWILGAECAEEADPIQNSECLGSFWCTRAMTTSLMPKFMLMILSLLCETMLSVLNEASVAKLGQGIPTWRKLSA